jgi:CheY-like chemotaxis protein
MAVHELATNAAKYGALSADSGSVTVEWRTDVDRDQLQICWTERGGPPVQPPESGGFGRLLLERALAADLGGEVEMNFAAAGLTCTIRIPLSENAFGTVADFAARKPARPATPARGEASATEGGRPQLRILVVEDEYLLANALANDLASAGHAVVGPFAGLGTAKAGLRKERIDLAILDVNLGAEVVYPLADELTESKIPFILLTGYGANDLPQRFRRSPRLAKPHDASALLRAIEQSVEHGIQERT